MWVFGRACMYRPSPVSADVRFEEDLRRKLYTFYTPKMNVMLTCLLLPAFFPRWFCSNAFMGPRGHSSLYLPCAVLPGRFAPTGAFPPQIYPAIEHHRGTASLDGETMVVHWNAARPCASARMQAGTHLLPLTSPLTHIDTHTHYSCDPPQRSQGWSPS